MRKTACSLVLAGACYSSPDVSDDTTADPPLTTSASSDEGADTGEPSSTAPDTTPTTSTTTATSDPATGDTSASTSLPADDESSGSSGGAMCLPATGACTDVAQCCAGLECGTTSLGMVCCGGEGIACNTPNGEDCCGDLLCIAGVCGYDGGDGCEPPCTEAPALVIEKQRLINDIGGTFLGICGDANHTYGYHVPAANLPADDYSLEGAANIPVCEWHAAAIDVGMDWPASRDWLKWLIPQIANDNIKGIAEVIGSYDGVDVRYWSDSTGWSVEGIPYQGEGHDTHTHVSIYRSTALTDHGILAGWTADGGP